MKVLVAGAKGMVGSGIAAAFESQGFSVVRTFREELDLEDLERTLEYVGDIKPTVIVNAAAKVGGVLANSTYPVDFLVKNIQIQGNLIQAAQLADVSRFVFLGSSCIYPRNSPQPIKEEYLLTGSLESTNSAYSIAKIAGIELVKSYRKQFGKNWISLMPTNIFGPGDNFNLEQSHVIPALIRKFVSAKEEGLGELRLWGDGSPLREFLYVSDLARAVVLATNIYDSDLPLNIGTGYEISIKQLAIEIASQVGFEGEISWDVTKPNGTPRKVLDIQRLTDLGWKPEVSLSDGIRETIRWYQSNLSTGGVRL
jgi:GDP-L-fucose synthase